MTASLAAASLALDSAALFSSAVEVAMADGSVMAAFVTKSCYANCIIETEALSNSSNVA